MSLNYSGNYQSISITPSATLDTPTPEPMFVAPDIATSLVLGASDITTSVLGNLTVETLFSPSVDNVCDLGETTKRFKELHLAGSALIGKTGQFKICATDGASSDAFSILIGNAATGESCTAGDNSIFIGPNAGTSSADSTNNIGIGKNALNNASLNTGKGNNVSIGVGSGSSLTTGTDNLFLGEVAGNAITTGIQNTMIGANSDGAATSNNQISIGYMAVCGTGNQCTIGDANLDTIRAGGASVCDLGQPGKQFKDLYLSGGLVVDTVQVVGSQGAAVIDATDAATAITQLNALLARCRAHGLIA